jgi:Uma2 family endonuclease
MASVAQKPITAEEFALLPDPPDGTKQELVRGVIVTMPPPGFDHGLCRTRISGLLDHHARSKHLGRVTVETGLVTERDPDTVRGPDVAFWSYERLPSDQRPQGYPSVTADLCVEVLSPKKRLRQIREKMREYFERGVRLVWVVDPEDHTVMVYRSPDEGRLLHETSMLSGEEVLPEFSCRVAELFA